MSKGPVSPLSPSKPRRATLTNPIRGSNNWIQAMAESNDGIVIGTRMRLAIQARPGTAVRSSSQDCESHPRTDDDSIVAFCHCLDPIVGSPYRIGQRCSARLAGTEWGNRALGHLFTGRHVLRAGTTTRAFRLSDDRRLVPRHGPVSGRAECHGGTDC